MTTVLCAHFVTFALGMHESTWSLERPSIGSKGHQPFEPMLGLSKEPGAGSEGAGTEGGIMGTSLTGTVNKLRATGAPTGPTSAGAPGGDLWKPPGGVVPNGRGGGATGPTTV